jgi:type I restriction enzyme S subunit
MPARSGWNVSLCSSNDSGKVLTNAHEEAKSIGVPDLGIQNIKDFSVPIPPLPEQQEIVRRVEALFAFADRIEERYAKVKAHMDKLTQSILVKAFRGELVPQDPNDEPASVLLERIRQERADHEKRKGNKRTGKCRD